VTRVFEVIQHEDFATQKMIYEKTFIPPRTIKYAIKVLKEQDLIKEAPNWRDMREKKYLMKKTPLQVVHS
jgi:predicted transcriptional regulator